MRLRLPLTLALILPFACASMWVRSYWWADFAWAGGLEVGSEAGTIYAAKGAAPPRRYYMRHAWKPGTLEDGSNLTYRPWRPFWTWQFNGGRLVLVRWWFITGLSALPAVWTWRRAKRRRREGARGFEVTTGGNQAG